MLIMPTDILFLFFILFIYLFIYLFVYLFDSLNNNIVICSAVYAL